MCPLEDNLLNPKVGDFLLDKERYKEKKNEKEDISVFKQQWSESECHTESS